MYKKRIMDVMKTTDKMTHLITCLTTKEEVEGIKILRQLMYNTILGSKRIL